MPISSSDDMLQCYGTQSAVTDPGDFARLYDSLPESVEDIGRTLQNVLVHNWKVKGSDRLTEDRRAEIEIRPIARLLARIDEVDPRSWAMERPMDRRVVVDCRHFATLLCSVLRHRGVPARTRHGFASYLEPGHRQSHVICEYWNAAEDRWVPVDPDTVQQDMPGDRFMTADAAWRAVRTGALDGAEFGYSPDFRGAWCARWEIVRDFAALNKHEMLTFDVWGINASYGFDESLQPQDAALLDHIAALLQDERRHFTALRALYDADERVRVPRVIRSQPYTSGLTHVIDLVLDGSMRADMR